VPKSLRHLKLVPVLGLAAVALLLPASASGGSAGGVGPGTPSDPAPAPVAGERAKLLPSGLAAAPESAPAKVKRAIDAANRIDGAGYCMGGGHGKERCYDCSGTASYVLGPKGADILEAPLPSGDFRKWGERGKGTWITAYYNSGHMYLVIAGLRFDTSQPDDGAAGPGWSKDVKAGLVNGPFKKRYHPGL
jgi:hypothetical protein